MLHQKHGSALRSTNLVEHLRGCPKFGGVEKNHPPCHQLDGKKTLFYSFPSSSSSCTPTRPSRRPRHPSLVAAPLLAGDALPPTVCAPPPLVAPLASVRGHPGQPLGLHLAGAVSAPSRPCTRQWQCSAVATSPGNHAGELVRSGERCPMFFFIMPLTCGPWLAVR